MGATEQQWNAYYEAVAAHEIWCEHKERAFDTALYLMKDIVTDDQYAQMVERLQNEIRMTRSMDAPNKPGY